MAVAVDRNGGFKLFKRYQRCRLQSYSHLDCIVLEPSQPKLSNSLKQPCEALNFHRSLSTPCLPLTPHEEDFEKNPRIEIVGGHRAPGVRSLIVEVSMAIALGVDPLPVSSGLGGAYLLQSRNGKNIAVTKPVDEEPFALNNPKGIGGQMLGQPGIKSSVRIGETGIRELAAYLLDHGGFASVPPSALVKISHVPFHLNNAATVSSAMPYKIASLQRFIDHEYDAGELGPLGFSVASVHQIGILDIRLLNLDRHAGNILVKKTDCDSLDVGVGELVPIDHGLCLPEWLDDPYFEWLHWPQSSVPFSESEVAYVSNLDPFKDAELLRTEIPSLRESCIRVLVLCTIFLKQAVASGLCLAAIGKMMSREFCAGEEKSSALENVCAQAKASISSIFNADEGKDLTEEPSLFHIGSEDSVQDTPQITRPKKLSISLSAGFIAGLADSGPSPSFEEDNYDDLDGHKPNSTEGKNGSYDTTSEVHNKVPSMVRSKSSLAHNSNKETRAVTFGDMTEDNWNLFLKNFDGLLPEVLERAKFVSQKQRFGTCKF